MISKLKDKSGITVVELIISVAILGIIVVPIFNLFTNTIRNNVRAKEMLKANQLAQQYMEECKMLINTQNVVIDPNTGNIMGVWSESVGKYDLTANISTVNNKSVTPTTGDKIVPTSSDITIDLSSYIGDSVVNLDINHDYSYQMKREGSSIVSSGTIAGSGDMVLKVEYRNSDINAVLNITNNSDRKLVVYKIVNNSDSNVNICALNGEVESYDGLRQDVFDQPEYKGRLYRINVSVQNDDGKNLVNLASLVTIKSNQ